MLAIDWLLYEKDMSKRELSRRSEIPYSCISDICTRKTNIKNITLENSLKLSKTLHVKPEALLRLQDEREFEEYRSDIQHEIKKTGQLQFLLSILKGQRIQKMFNAGLKTEALYLLACVDYLSRINEIPVTNIYDKYRKFQCSETLYPRDLLLGGEDEKMKAINNSIPEFGRFNIVEVDFLNVA